MASKMTMVWGSHSGALNIGSMVPVTCTSSQAPTRYSPAIRMTFRRFSSAKKFFISTQSRIQSNQAAITLRKSIQSLLFIPLTNLKTSGTVDGSFLNRGKSHRHNL